MGDREQRWTRTAAFALLAVLAFGPIARGGDDERPRVARKDALSDVLGLFVGGLSLSETWRSRRTWLTRPANAPEPHAQGMCVQVYDAGAWFPYMEPTRCVVSGLRPSTHYLLAVRTWSGVYAGFQELRPPYVDGGRIYLPFKTDAEGSGGVDMSWTDSSDNGGNGVPQYQVAGNPFQILDPESRVVLQGVCLDFGPDGDVRGETRDATSGVDVRVRMRRSSRPVVERMTIDARHLPHHVAADVFIADATGTLVRVGSARTGGAGRARFAFDARRSRPLPFGEPDITRFFGRAFEVRLDGRAVASETLPVFADAPQGTRTGLSGP
jgi:hypothetical protein